MVFSEKDGGRGGMFGFFADLCSGGVALLPGCGESSSTSDRLMGAGGGAGGREFRDRSGEEMA